VDEAGRVLVLGSSLATYSAWRLIKRAKDQGKPIGIVNLGGVRGEEVFLETIPITNTGRFGVRCSQELEKVLPALVTSLKDGSAMALRSRPFQPAAWA